MNNAHLEVIGSLDVIPGGAFNVAKTDAEFSLLAIAFSDVASLIAPGYRDPALARAHLASACSLAIRGEDWSREFARAKECFSAQVAK